jgi:hypothetical protein
MDVSLTVEEQHVVRTRAGHEPFHRVENVLLRWLPARVRAVIRQHNDVFSFVPCSS